jgi:hypothetical protein
LQDKSREKFALRRSVEREQYKLLIPSPQLKIHDIFMKALDVVLEEIRIM